MRAHTCATNLIYLDMLLDNYRECRDLELIIYTNKLDLVSPLPNSWEIRYLDFEGNDIQFSRFIKMEYVPKIKDFPVVYIDSTIEITQPSLFEYLYCDTSSEVVLFAHNKRKSGFTEVLYLYMVGKLSFWEIFIFCKYWMNKGFKSKLILGGIYVLNSIEGRRHFIDWTTLYKQMGIERDQPSLSLVVSRAVEVLDQSVIVRTNSYRNRRIVNVFVQLKRILKVS